MVLFPVLAAVTLLGIGYVLLSLKKESSQTEDALFEPAVTPQPKIKTGNKGPRKSLFSKVFKPKKLLKEDNVIEFAAPKPARTSLLAKLLKKKSPGSSDASAVKPQRKSIIASLKDSLSKIKRPGKIKDSTAGYSTLNDALSINTIQIPDPEPIKSVQPETPEKISTEEAEQIRQDVRKSSELQDLQEKYDKLDALFSEKSKALQETEEKLQSEIQNRKDYTKVKDILETELTETKSRLKNAHNEIKTLNEELNILKYTQNKPPSNMTIDPVSSLENEFTPPPKPVKTEAAPAVSEEPVRLSLSDINTKDRPESFASQIEAQMTEDSKKFDEQPDNSADNEPPAPPKREENEPQEENKPQDPPGFLSLKPDVVDEGPDNNNPNTKE